MRAFVVLLSRDVNVGRLTYPAGPWVRVLSRPMAESVLSRLPEPVRNVARIEATGGTDA